MTCLLPLATQSQSQGKVGASLAKAVPVGLVGPVGIGLVGASVQAGRPVGVAQLHSEVRRGVHQNTITKPHQILSDEREQKEDVSSDLARMVEEIHQELAKDQGQGQLEEMSTYYFDGQGKAIRPVLTLMMANAVNSHLDVQNTEVIRLQRQVAIISEMYHTSSLVHDDVIDDADVRRSKMSVNRRWGEKRSVMTGDYILAVSAKLLALTRNPQVVIAMSQILEDLVNGELQQMASRNDSQDRFMLYIDKTFNKTASLMAYSCKSVAILAAQKSVDTHVEEIAFQYGKNVGLAFQLVDDWLDFVASADQLGKPAAADLKLGLATAPVLFASQQFPELHPLILRNFCRPGDVETAFDIVMKSQGLAETQLLATQYCQAAVRGLEDLKDSHHKRSLIGLVEKVVNRMN